MRLLVWHWGRYGAGPLFALRLAEALAGRAEVNLSLAAGAELLGRPGMECGWKEPTYHNAAGYIWQRFGAPGAKRRVARRLAALRPDFAICAMPALLDGRMRRALRRRGIPYGVIVHDATAHPGEALRFRLLGQARLLRDANCLFPLSAHVAAELRRQGYGAGDQRIVQLWHPVFDFGAMRPAFRHPGKPRVLCFGRLLPYKGLDLLADALEALGPELPFDVKICGEGPVSAELSRLGALGAEIDRRWIPEAELPGLIEWSDAVVLPYREASQSGAAAAALGQGRLVVATRVGGLPEQLEGRPGAILCAPEGTAIAAALRRISPELCPDAADATSDWAAMAAKLLAALPRS